MEIEGLDDLNTSIDPVEDPKDVDPPAGGDGGTEPPTDPEPPQPGAQDPPAGGEGDDPEGGEGGEGGEPKEGDEPGSGTENLTGIELYLSQFGIDGGMIQFEDGESKHFNDLDKDKQAEILASLKDMTTPGIEEKYGLDEDEIGLINYLRQTGSSIEEVVDQMAQQRAQAYIMQQQVQTVDVEQMDDDTVYASFLLQNNPEATVEQIDKDLATAKKQSNFKNIVNGLRKEIKESQIMMAQEQELQARQQTLQELEEQRQEVVQTIAPLKDIDGLKLNDGLKNDVLDLILNVDEDGDSMFMSHVFSDPHELFRAAFWYKNGADIIRSREEFWKKEKSAAYKRGVEDAKKGKKTFTASDLKENKTTPYLGASDDTVSLDELY